MLVRSRLVAVITLVSTIVSSVAPTGLTALQTRGEFDLHRRRHLADLVEENGAAVCRLEEPFRLALAPVKEPLRNQTTLIRAVFP